MAKFIEANKKSLNLLVFAKKVVCQQNGERSEQLILADPGLSFGGRSSAEGASIEAPMIIEYGTIFLPV